MIVESSWLMMLGALNPKDWSAVFIARHTTDTALYLKMINDQRTYIGNNGAQYKNSNKHVGEERISVQMLKHSTSSEGDGSEGNLAGAGPVGNGRRRDLGALRSH
ncbi:hypothetical protein AB6A40_005665 [Gnathostoma spinigerum]|uniref:Uncharacterized protein n=1 Tax=Gnathostoma spinigerum TaxID=75299 RepID=A0ABD6ENF3_9BILA